MEYNFLEKALEFAPISDCGKYQILMKRKDQTRSSDLFSGSKKLSRQILVENIIIYKLWDNDSGELVDGIEYPDREEDVIYVGDKKFHSTEFKHPSGRKFIDRLDEYVFSRRHYFGMRRVEDKLTLTLNKDSYRRLVEYNMSTFVFPYADPYPGTNPYAITRYRGIPIEVSEDMQQEFLISMSEPSLF